MSWTASDATPAGRHGAGTPDRSSGSTEAPRRPPRRPSSAAAAGAGSRAARARRIHLIEVAQRRHAPEVTSSQVRWGLLIDTTKCSRAAPASSTPATPRTAWPCPTPTSAQWIRKVEIKDQDRPPGAVPVMCQHCAEPPCVDVCPTGASFKRADGIVLVDRHACIGCRYCVMACPYKARSFVHEPLANQKPEVPRGRAASEGCTLCVQRRPRRHAGLRRGLRQSRHHAMLFGNLNDPDSAIAKTRARARRRASCAPTSSSIRACATWASRRPWPRPTPARSKNASSTCCCCSAAASRRPALRRRTHGDAGHAVTGMTIRWSPGLPHVFAIFLIVAASGVLNVASIGSVFGQAPTSRARRCRPALLAMLAGGPAGADARSGRPIA